VNISTFGTWDATVLSHCYDYVDYLSMHQYFDLNENADAKDFLANTLSMDNFIKSVASICDYVKAVKKSKKTINISFDEWNVWYHSKAADAKADPWCLAPHLLEDIYNFMDALLVGGMLITLLKHADRVKIACLAQLVNVIAPIMTSDTGAWRQTIYWPYLHASLYGRGTVLQTLVDAPKYDSKNYTDVPYLDSVAVQNDEQNRITIFALNRDLDEDMEVTTDLRQYEGYHVARHIVMTHADLEAINDEAHPNNVVPVEGGNSKLDAGVLTSVLPAKSWNVIILEK